MSQMNLLGLLVASLTEINNLFYKIEVGSGWLYFYRASKRCDKYCLPQATFYWDWKEYIYSSSILLMVQIVFVQLKLFFFFIFTWYMYKIIDPVQNLLKWFHYIFLRNSLSW